MAIGSRIVLPELSGDWAKDGPTMKRALDSYINSLQVVSQGVWTPVLTFATPGDLSVTYSTQNGAYYRFGSLVLAVCAIVTSAFTHTTAAGNLRITGLPFAADTPGAQVMIGDGVLAGITKAGYTDISPGIADTTSYIEFYASGSGSALANVTSADVPTGGGVVINISTIYPA